MILSTRSTSLPPSFRARRALLELTVLGIALLALVGSAGSDLGAGRSTARPPGLGASTLPAPAMVRDDPAASSVLGSAGGLEPGIQFEEAMAHHGDRIVFTPGGRVTTPFEPRARDAWPVSSGVPQRLPAGRQTGLEMLTQPQGRVAPGDEAIARPVNQAILTSYAESPSTDSRVAAAPTGLRRQVFGFLPYWALGQSSTVIRYEVLSTIAYFGVGADAGGNLQKQGSSGTTPGWAGWTSAALTTVIDKAHARGTRVVLTVEMFGWTSAQSAAQLAFLTNPAAQRNLASQIAAAVRDRGADGVNLDFEPIVQGGAAGYVDFVRLLRAQLNAVSRGYELTVETTGKPANYDLEGLTGPGGADAVFIMGYDYRADSSSVAGSVAPMGGPNYDLAETIQAYLARIPASKVILGLPWYGRAWSTATNAPNAPNQSGARYGYSTAVPYDQAADLAAQYGRNYDPIEQSAWFAYQRQNCTTAYGCVTSWREVYYDDAQSLGAKYDLVNRYGLRGVGIWTLGYDGSHPELYQTLADRFLDDRVPPVSGIVDMAASQTDEGFPVSWTAWDDWSGVRSYDVQVSVDGGPWSDWLTATKATNAIYLGVNGHAYAFRARATDGKGNRGAWSAAPIAGPGGPAAATLAKGGFGRVVATTVNLRNAASPTASRIGTAAAGSVVAVLAGPVQAGGYAWYQVTVPVTEWPPVANVQTGVWAAASDGRNAFIVPIPAPNTTAVSAGIAGVTFGDGGPASLGPAGAAARSFSPNGDGSQDGLTLHWTNGVAFDSLSLRVFRPDGTQVATQAVNATSLGPQTLPWIPAPGTALPDGTYALQLVGASGGRTYTWPSTVPTMPQELATYGLTVDTVPPVLGSASLAPTAFSPNGDGQADTVAASISVPGGVRWALVAAPEVVGAGDGVTVGPPIRTITGKGPTGKVTWDGKDDAGAPAPDGRYRVTLSGFDAAGNAAGRSFEVTIDRAVPLVTLGVEPPSFSPNGDGIADRTSITWTSDSPVSGTVAIYSGSRAVRTWPIKSSAGSKVVWNGRNGFGGIVADGRYTVRLDLRDAAQNRVQKTVAVTVDRAAGGLTWSAALFYPQDGDAISRTSVVSFRLTKAATTKLTILDATGAVVRTAWSSRTQRAGVWSWTWDGRNGQKAYVAPGTYTARLEATTSLGTIVLTRPVVADAFQVTPSAAMAAHGTKLILTIRSAEALRSAPSVTFSVAGAPPISVKATASGALVFRVTLSVGQTAGAGTLVVSGTDAGGKSNRTMLSITVT